MKPRSIFAAACATVAAAAAPAGAQPEDLRYHGDHGGWVTLARKGVNARLDADRIALPGAARYRKLRLCSLDAPFNLRQVSVIYANGQRQAFKARGLVESGMCTRRLDLDGKRRDIAEIYLTYARVVRGYKPQLIVQGRI